MDIIGIRLGVTPRTRHCDPAGFPLEVGEACLVDTEHGLQFGTVVAPILGNPFYKVGARLPKVVRRASRDDEEAYARKLATEKEARANGYKLKIGKMPLTSVARAIERGETAGLMKVVVDAATDRILGASILASEGGELVQILGFLMLAGQPYTLLKGAVYIHPTLAEGFFGLMENVKPVD